MKPCPFCGSTKITVEWESCPPLDATDTNRRWFAECTQCSAQGPFCQKEPEVIPAWNKRAVICDVTRWAGATTPEEYIIRLMQEEEAIHAEMLELFKKEGVRATVTEGMKG